MALRNLQYALDLFEKVKVNPFPWIEIIIPTQRGEEYDKDGENAYEVYPEGVNIHFTGCNFEVIHSRHKNNSLYFSADENETLFSFDQNDYLILTQSLNGGWTGCFFALPEDNENKLVFVCAYKYIPKSKQKKNEIKLTI